MDISAAFFMFTDERYFAIEHMDVRREAFQGCTAIKQVSIKVHHLTRYAAGAGMRTTAGMQEVEPQK